MFYTLFESTTPADKVASVAKYKSKLEGLLEIQKGFISNTAFRSATDADKQTLVAVFTDEEAAHDWRRNSTHLWIQKTSRENIFGNYRIRAGPEISFDDGQEFDHKKEASKNEGQTLMLLEYLKDAGAEPLDLDQLRLEYSEDKLIDVVSYVNETTVLQILHWKTIQAAREFRSIASLPDSASVRFVSVVREYGKTDREQAPRDADETQVKTVG